MTSAAKVAEIFITAGTAFSKLGEMTMDLQKDETKSSSTGKWTDEEIDLLKVAVYKFGQDIEKISDMVRSRTAKQIKEAMRRRNMLTSVAHADSTTPLASNPEQNNTVTHAVDSAAKPDATQSETEKINGREANETANNDNATSQAKRLKTLINSSNGSDEHDEIDVVNDNAVSSKTDDSIKTETADKSSNQD
jgi:hypothetical protein